MINFLWMLYIALMLFSTGVAVVSLVDRKHEDDDGGVIAFIILFTCLMWGGFVAYYLN